MRRAWWGLLVFAAAVASVRGDWPTPTGRERALDRVLASLSSRLGYSSRINPTAGSQRREKTSFFEARARGRRYEPRFDYEPLAEGVAERAAVLAAARGGDGPYGGLLDGVRREALAKYQVLAARGTDRFAAAAALLYAPPDDDLVAAARRVLFEEGRTGADEPSTVSAETMAERLRTGLAEYGLHDWTVVLAEHMSARASVLPLSRKVKIRPGVRFGETDVVRLVRHEVGVHAVRAANGGRAPLRIFTMGLAGYLPTEEGLAAMNEVRHGVRTGLRLFALRVLAVHEAATAPFSAVYEMLLDRGADDEAAWAIALRAKRGMVDTGMPGAYTKDAVYLRGYRQVAAWLDEGGSWDEALRRGKVGLGDLPRLRRWDGCSGR